MLSRSTGQLGARGGPWSGLYLWLLVWGESSGPLESREGIQGQPLASCMTSSRSPVVQFPLQYTEDSRLLTGSM